MSLGEIIVILIVAIIALKPSDYSNIAIYIRDLYKYYINFRRYLEREIHNIANDASLEELQEEQINFYLQKIFEMNQRYNGEYSLEAIRKYYYKILLEDNLAQNKSDK
ncbi:MAG: DUF2672 domain-containing protein [Rickettsiaceae bacterium]|nr:DUF2672 domain-containing protein [Rickettsiaceae bacterium]